MDDLYIDIHTHGIGVPHGVDTRGGVGGIVEFAAREKSAGVAAFLPTIYSAAPGVMREQMGRVREAMRETSGSPLHARILGVHLEGPFLNPRYAGALDRDSFAIPSVDALDALIEGHEDIVRVLTISPELPGALGVIERCAALDIRASMGHSAATYAEALAGRRAGATGVTHLFNAMRPFHHREPGLVGLALLDDGLFVEVIADGLHLAPETLRMVFRTKPRGRVIAVSDSVAGPGEVGGVLQGSEVALPEIAVRLRAMGIAEEDVAEAVGPSALRYLGIERSVI